MYINQIYELSMVLNNDKFHKVLSWSHKRPGCLEENDGELVDRSMATKGMTIAYRDSQYKKKVKVVINSGRVMDYDKTEPDKFLRKIDKRMGEYFDHKYSIDDFSLSGVTFAMDIDVDSRESVSAYLKVLRRVGRVKGFKPVVYECFEDIGNFCLEGNSNGIEFLLYNIEDYVARRYKETGDGRKKLEGMHKKSEGILRAEVRLMKPKAFRDYTDATEVSGQIMEMLEKCQDIFLDTFVKIIPYGDSYKKNKTLEIIQHEVKDNVLRRKMLRLVALIPEKKSLYLAQKAMECRNMEKIMRAFAKINVSPVTISRRQEVKYLKNIYEYLFT